MKTPIRIGLYALLAFAPGVARAGGVAFPNTYAVLVPADRPGDIFVTGNVGVVASHDGGGTWTWSCNQGVADNAVRHQLGPGPRDRLFALSGPLIYSDDGACGWQTAGGLLAGNGMATALWSDPTDADRVLAAAQVADGDGGLHAALLESGDGGAAFATVRYTTDAGAIVSVEGARADRATIYMTTYAGPSVAPALLRSRDGGSSFAPIDLGANAAGRLDILSVDPIRADKLYLRLAAAGADALVVVDGTAATSPVQFVNGRLTAFVRATDGTLLVAGLAGFTPALYASADGGASFAPIAGAPHINGLVARGGLVYAATDPGREAFAEATSSDDGVTWQPGLRYEAVEAIAPCLKATCQTECALWVGQGLWPAPVCSADPTTGTDAGTDARVDASPDASRDATVTGDGSADAKSGLVRRGCACALASDRAGGVWSAVMVVIAVRALARRRGRRRRVNMMSLVKRGRLF